jgi:DNA-binding NarL/FixJ family response regulator
MFRKVLINDDHDAIIASVEQILTDNNVTQVDKSKYCDEAFLKLKRADLDDTAYDLLITDLSFKRDHRNTHITTGEDLIEKLRQEYSNIPIIVYSMKDQLQKVRLLINHYGVNAYVCKDRQGSKELYAAIKTVARGELFLSPQVKRALHSKANLEIDDYDIQLLRMLSQGLSQEDISSDYKNNGVSPNSLSTIEKRLNKLKMQFKANNAIHLVAITKDLGVI